MLDLIKDVEFKYKRNHTEKDSRIQFKIGTQYCDYIFKKEKVQTKENLEHIKRVVFRKTFIEKGYGGVKYMDITVEEWTDE